MKGKIITETIYEGWLAWSHGMGEKVKRLIIPEADNLAITLHNEELYVFTGFTEDKTAEVLQEIEVPDELVKQALGFLETKKELQSKFKMLF